MEFPSPNLTRASTTRQARSSTRWRWWAPSARSPNPPPRRNPCSTVSGGCAQPCGTWGMLDFTAEIQVFIPHPSCASLDWIGNAVVALMLERLRFLGIICQSVSFSRSGVELLRSIYRALELCSSVFYPSALIPKNRSGWTGLGATMAGCRILPNNSGILWTHEGKLLILTPTLSLSRTALSEKKPTVKPKSPEKSKPEEKDPEKSPTKKQEGGSSWEFL